MSYPGVVVSPGNVPVYHGTDLKATDRRVRLAELILRCVICVSAFVSAILVASDIQKKAKFTDMKALVFLVIANGVAAAYSLFQISRCVLSMIRGNVLVNKPLAWIIFSGDQVMCYLSLTAVGAAGQSAAFAKMGQKDLQWMMICNLYAKFCNQIGDGIASAILVSLSLAGLSGLSAFSLFLLYGDINKGKNIGRRWSSEEVCLMLV